MNIIIKLPGKIGEALKIIPKWAWILVAIGIMMFLTLAGLALYKYGVIDIRHSRITQPK